MKGYFRLGDLNVAITVPNRESLKLPKMTTGLELKRKIFESPGYSADVRLGADELAVFRSAITEQWISVIGAQHPDLAPRFQQAGLPNYHTLSHLIDHEKVWPKKNRCLPFESCRQIKTLPFLQILKAELGRFRAVARHLR